MPKAVKSRWPLTHSLFCKHLCLSHEALTTNRILVPCLKLPSLKNQEPKLISSITNYFVITIEKRVRKPPKLSFRDHLMEERELQGKATNITMTQEKMSLKLLGGIRALALCSMQKLASLVSPKLQTC